jgi:hypothetical protein
MRRFNYWFSLTMGALGASTFTIFLLAELAK